MNSQLFYVAAGLAVIALFLFSAMRLNRRQDEDILRRL